MRKPTLLILVTALLAGGASALISPTAAGAASTVPVLNGIAAGSNVVGLNGVLTSGPTAGSGLACATKAGLSNTNSVASASVASLLSLGAVTTSVTSAAIVGGFSITSRARTASISVLGGKIKADAVETTSVAKMVLGVYSSTSSTKFVNLRIPGKTIPVIIPKNYTISIPGVIGITLNLAFSNKMATGGFQGVGVGIRVQLLGAVGNSPAGTLILVSPTIAEAGTPVLAPVGGSGYVAKATIAGGTVLSASLGNVATSGIGCKGTGGKDRITTTGAFNLPGVHLDGASTTANGLATTTLSDARMQVDVAGVNLFGGQITADALKGVAHVNRTGAGPTAVGMSTQLVNLRIGGHLVAVNVSPNTVITVAGLGKVTINTQLGSANRAVVRLLDIVLSTAGYGLPAGAHVEVGFASAQVYVP